MSFRASLSSCGRGGAREGNRKATLVNGGFEYAAARFGIAELPQGAGLDATAPPPLGQPKEPGVGDVPLAIKQEELSL